MSLVILITIGAETSPSSQGTTIGRGFPAYSILAFFSSPLTLEFYFNPRPLPKLPEEFMGGGVVNFY